MCLNDYTCLKICEKEKWIVQKDQVKRKKDLEQKKKMKKNDKKKREKKYKCNLSFIVKNCVELLLFEKKNCATLVFRNYFVPYISFLHIKPLTL